MWDTQIRGASSVLSNEDIYRYVIEWANASSDAAQRTLDGEELTKVCWDKMGQFQDDLLGYHMALDEIDLKSTAVGLGIAVGAETAVTPKSQQQRWLSKCVDEVEEFFDEVIRSGAYDPCEELGKKMNAATSPEEYAAYENLFIGCIGE